MNQFLNGAPEITESEIKTAVADAVKQTAEYLPKFTDQFKYSHSEGNFYAQSDNVEWTTGFWTGEIWLAYENSGNESFKTAALRQVDSFLERIEKHVDVDHHDMGFLYSPSCVAAYKLTGSETGRKAAVMAADNLISRFQEKGQFLQAWGPLGAKDNYRLIIDCLLNLPLLYWASETTGDPKYADIAHRHSTTALKYVLRDDSSTYHTYFFDPETGAPLYGAAAQGYKNESAWARGQAWGVYGAALGYRYRKDPEYISIFEKVTDFFLDHLPSSLVPFWDFSFSDGDSEPRDSSASAIAVCGMLEMAKYLDAGKAAHYNSAARKLLKALADTCAVKEPGVSNGQLLHGTYAKHSPYNTCPDRGIDECNTWGDYFYVEALTRLSKDWNLYW